MTSQATGLLIGGLLPALFFGLSGFFVKPATQAGIGTGLYLVVTGLAITAAGVAYFMFNPDKTLSLRSGIYAALVGLTWAIAAAMIAYALAKYGLPISKLVPLYNMNTIVAVFLGLFLLAEWKDVNTVKLLLGSLMVIAGGSLVATS